MANDLIEKMGALEMLMLRLLERRWNRHWPREKRELRIPSILVTAACRALCASLTGLLIGCVTVQGETPNGKDKVYVASAYSLSGCQEKLDEEAGQHVQITEHTQAVLASVLNFGITPAYVCHGVVPPGTASPASDEYRMPK